MNELEQLCKSHRTRRFFDTGGDLIGVINHAGMFCWYKYIPGVGYSLTGTTDTDEGAEMRSLDDGENRLLWPCLALLRAIDTYCTGDSRLDAAILAFRSRVEQEQRSATA